MTFQRRWNGKYHDYSKTRNYLYTFIISSIEVSALYWRIRLMLAKSFSIGFNSGEYGGKNNKLAPHSRINASVCEPLWKEALSIITTWLSSSKGHNISESHVLKATASQLPLKSTGAVKHPSSRAAIKVVVVYR